jgi:hypothetical protein
VIQPGCGCPRDPRRHHSRLGAERKPEGAARVPLKVIEEEPEAVSRAGTALRFTVIESLPKYSLIV